MSDEIETQEIEDTEGHKLGRAYLEDAGETEGHKLGRAYVEDAGETEGHRAAKGISEADEDEVEGHRFK